MESQASFNKDKITGVYVVQGPAGVYVGEAVDCFARNRKINILGIPWGIVRELPGSTRRERIAVERQVADAWEARGFVIVSRNTSAGRRFSPEHRAKLSAANKGKHHSRKTKEKIGASRRGKLRSLETRKKISASKVGIPRSTEVRRKISATKQALSPKKRAEIGEKISREKIGKPWSPKVRATRAQTSLSKKSSRGTGNGI